MMSLTSFCQTTNKSEYKKVKKTTLINIKKKVEKCDSLAVRYDEKTQALNELILSNEKNSLLLISERDKSKQYQAQIHNLQSQLKSKKSKKSNKIILGVSAGTVVGIIVGVLISK